MISEILAKEKVLKEAEYRHGQIYLTEHNLLWRKKVAIDNLMIPLPTIKKVEQASRMGLGVCLRVVYGDPEQVSFLPFTGEGVLGSAKVDDLRDWMATLKTGVVSRGFLSNVVYMGGHTAFPQRHVGQITITPVSIIFQEMKGRNQSIEGDFRLEIPFKKIKNISISKEMADGIAAQGAKAITDIVRVKVVFPDLDQLINQLMTHRLVLIDYIDRVGIRQTPSFNFPGDRGHRKKEAVMKAFYDRMKTKKLPIKGKKRKTNKEMKSKAREE
ncbi:MAG TPA: hypothetical protein VJ574_06075 [Candidatus Bathyarchaeia archaeon]|nr:hypothetical protein [Candidatus Bathyarchaeia archaeon]